MIADYAYYNQSFHGTLIPQAEYTYFAERASDRLARYQPFLPSSDGAQNALKKCACAISEILYNNVKGSKDGKQIASESVNGYYSVSFSTQDETALKSKINDVISDYLSVYFNRRAVVIY